jgi:hypothetical protein
MDDTLQSLSFANLEFVSHVPPTLRGRMASGFLSATFHIATIYGALLTMLAGQPLYEELSLRAKKQQKLSLRKRERKGKKKNCRFVRLSETSCLKGLKLQYKLIFVD